MKKIWWVLLVLLLVNFISAQNLYSYDSLNLNLDVKGEIELVDQGGGTLSSVKTTLNLYPATNFRQNLIDWTSGGTVKDNQVFFEWTDKKIEKKKYGFVAKIKNENKRVVVGQKVAFPLTSTDVKGQEEYLKATKTIDKDNSKIVSRATQLAQGETDLFEVMFKLAKWVEENTNYELDTLTSTTSQKASWVLENQRGVCDEMTSLFIALCRSLGIPARFVSGISYTTDPELIQSLGTSWSPHGWAEVYFPKYGWVSFDITFGEYGYVDVTHIKLRDGFDPTEPSTRFEWLADQIELKSKPLDFSVKVENKGNKQVQEIELNQEILAQEVGFGSHNLVMATIKNKNNYYLASTLSIATPKDVSIIGNKKKPILLKPFESKEVSWLVKVNPDLAKNYWYEFPVLVYSEKNVSVSKKFKAVKGKISYSLAEAEKLMIKERGGKTYSKEVNLKCNYSKEIKVGEKKEISCRMKNTGNTNLKGINFCVGEVCREVVSLPLNQEEELKIKITGEQTGWHKILVKAKNQEINQQTYLEYAVYDSPNISLQIISPSSVDYKKDFNIQLGINRSSFSLPKKIKVVLKNSRWQNQWTLAELKTKKDLKIKLNSAGLGKQNKFQVDLFWENKQGEKFKNQKSFMVKIKGKTFWEKITLWFNGLADLFN